MVNDCLARLDEGPKSYHSEKLEWCERALVNHIRSAGYLQAQLQQTTKVAPRGYVVSVAVNEGKLFRLGKIDIKGFETLTKEQIKSHFRLREGDIAAGDKISKWLFEDLKNVYGELGFIQYTADLVPTFKPEKGIVDLEVEIDEGKRYSLRSITFVGDLVEGINLERLLLLHAGDVYNYRLFRESIARLNASGLYAPVDADADVDLRTDDEDALVSVVIKLMKR